MLALMTMVFFRWYWLCFFGGDFVGVGLGGGGDVSRGVGVGSSITLLALTRVKLQNVVILISGI